MFKKKDKALCGKITSFLFVCVEGQVEGICGIGIWTKKRQRWKTWTGMGGLTFDVVENSVQEKEKEFP